MLITLKPDRLLYSKAIFSQQKSYEDYLRKKLQSKIMNINFFEL
jgi:hypothetical protein